MPDMSSRYAGVYILGLPFAADKIYDYEIPESLIGEIKPGTFVKVPFSKGNRSRNAVVVRLSESCEYDKIKPVLAVATDRISLNEEMLGLCSFLKERTFCTFTDAVHALAGQAEKIIAGNLKAINDELYSLAPGVDPNKVKGSTRKNAVILLGERGELKYSELKRLTGISRAQLSALEASGILVRTDNELFRNPYAKRISNTPDDNILSEEQQRAYKELEALLCKDSPQAALLFGVTGSGKTRVIKALIDRTVELKKSVIVLVPEISLTPQTADLFCSYYKNRVAVLHSSLTAAERFDTRRRIEAGEVDVVIGTRSAVFAPLSNLGLIVLDEEQEHTYKSDMAPKYHTKDIARYRAKYHNALMLLASATPSFESYYKGEIGKYTTVRLTERYGDAVLPTVSAADMRTDDKSGRQSPLGSVLTAEIEKNLKANEQTILFVNRRGYNNFVSCMSCGEVISCPNCSVSLTLHKSRYSSGTLVCHYCNHREKLPSKCPKCQKEHLSYKGFGTQLVEQELAEKFPGVRTLRMDADTVSGKASSDEGGLNFRHEELLADFRAHKADILIGTQMVTKGHDFPDVTLVGVIDADSALYIDDYRAGERAFDLLTQVIGRAGRASKRGRAVIQTRNPDNETLHFAKAQDYEGFYQSSIALRKQLVFPPFCDFAVISVSSDSEAELIKAIGELDRRIRELIGKGGEYSDIAAAAFRPSEAPVYKLNNIFRMRIVIKCAFTKRCRKLLSMLLEEFTVKLPKVMLTIDINPTNL